VGENWNYGSDGDAVTAGQRFTIRRQTVAQVSAESRLRYRQPHYQETASGVAEPKEKQRLRAGAIGCIGLAFLRKAPIVYPESGRVLGLLAFTRARAIAMHLSC